MDTSQLDCTFLARCRSPVVCYILLCFPPTDCQALAKLASNSSNKMFPPRVTYMDRELGKFTVHQPSNTTSGFAT